MRHLEPVIPRTEQPLRDLTHDELTQLRELARLVLSGNVRSVEIELDRRTRRLRLTTFAHPIVYNCKER